MSIWSQSTPNINDTIKTCKMRYCIASCLQSFFYTNQYKRKLPVVLLHDSFDKEFFIAIIVIM